MKTEHQVIILASVYALFFWVIDALLDYLFFYNGSYWGLLFLNVPGSKLYMRLVVVACFGTFGVIASWLLIKRRQVEELYHTIFETTGTATVTIEEDMTISLANAEFKKLSKYSKEEVEGRKNWAEFVAEDDLNRIRKYHRLAKIAPDAAPKGYEFKFIDRQGEIRDIFVTVGMIPGTKRSVASLLDITNRKRREEQLAYMATHDALTDLPNRVLLDDRLTLAIAYARRNQQKLAVILLDLDHFKNVNDERGHKLGDKVLQIVATRIKSVLRESDTVARMGGDEFVLILPEIAWVEDAILTVQRILEIVRKPFVIDDYNFYITVSAGIAIFPNDSKDADVLVRYSDIAMYHAKRWGRNAYQRYSEAMVAEPGAVKVAERRQATVELQQSFEMLKKTMENTILAMTRIVETKDPYTAGHQRRVTNLACAIAKEMDLSVEQISGIQMAAMIHDIGKIYVPMEILSKPGNLIENELNMVKAHPQLGYDVLKGLGFPWPVTEIVLQHHERIDGSGYPQGLLGKDILLEVRILAVADVVEAIVSHRPYRPALGISKALEEISKNKDVLYDSKVVDACLKLFAEKKFAFVQSKN